MHILSVETEHIIRKISKTFYFSADFIDVHPLAAFTYFFHKILENLPSDTDSKDRSMLLDIMDELNRCVGNRRITDDFDYPVYGRYRYIVGRNNKEVIECIIKLMRQCYERLY